MSDARNRTWKIMMTIDSDVKAVPEISRERSETVMVYKREKIVESGRTCLIFMIGDPMDVSCG